MTGTKSFTKEDPVWIIDDWHDLLRIATIALCLVTLIFLGKAWQKPRNTAWTNKTQDLWLGMVLWTVAGIALAVEGLLENRDLEPRPLFYFAASLVTFRGVHKKEGWGTDHG